MLACEARLFGRLIRLAEYLVSHPDQQDLYSDAEIADIQKSLNEYYESISTGGEQGLFEAVPLPVRRAVLLSHPDPVICRQRLQRTQIDTMMGCYFFMENGTYYGIEKDGHLHT